MLPCSVKVGRSFFLLQKFVTAALKPCPNFCRNNHNKLGTPENLVTTCIGFLIPTGDTGMSTLKPIICGRGFHSSAKIPTINLREDSETINPETSNCDNPCSKSVQATPEIEKKYVHHVYDAIAPHSVPPDLQNAKSCRVSDSLGATSVILDAGCGNGKYLGFNPNCFYIGCDISPSLIDICSRRGHEVLVADAVNLPYRSNFGDAAISIAVLHHLSTERRRRKAIEELIRVVKKGGLVLITVWAVEQEDQSLLTKWTPLSHKYNEGWISPSSPRTPRNSSTISLESIPETDANCHHFTTFSSDEQDQSCHDDNRLEDKVMMGASAYFSTRASSASSKTKAETNQEYFVPWHLPYHRAEISGASAAALANGLAKKDDKKGTMVYNRYYHVFAEGELERLAAGIENTTILEQFYDKSNWCIVLEKT